MDKRTALIADRWKESPYYEWAESAVNQFWGPEKIFTKRFKELDLANVVELACGHGRHVPNYYEKAGKITLVDVNQENIDFCKRRFGQSGKISFITNYGSDLNAIPDGTATAIFSYDAMVHFELSDVASYLKESWRALAPGGKILFHHSNNDANPGSEWTDNPHGRNFMSVRIFAHLASRAGFAIISQDILDWGNGDNFSPQLDCLSLCVK